MLSLHVYATDFGRRRDEIHVEINEIDDKIHGITYKIHEGYTKWMIL